MANALAHRGPDDHGTWLDEGSGLTLAHRRLSIVDLSPSGHQPMLSHSGRFALVFNGEIYNHRELRKQLNNAGITGWRGHSDTETLLEAIELWGLAPTINRCVGMFALALWDRAARTLHLARDRFGEKPLYYGWFGRAFLFGSELKAIRKHPAFVPDIDRDALDSFTRFGYVPGPRSIYKNVHKLPPGTVLELQSTSGHFEFAIPRPYWSAPDAALRGLETPLVASEEDIASMLETLLRDAVAQQMVADVPLGAFLSGGIDSSMIVALMQEQSPRPIRTFSIGFTEEGYDEATYARAVAQYLGTDHTELYVSAEAAQAVIPSLPDLYDEPFADSSQIPTYLVARLARQQVTVALSGDGGDELFGGYNRYSLGRGIWKRIARVPSVARKAAAASLRSLPAGCWDRLYLAASSLRPSLRGQSAVGDKIHKLAAVIDVSSADEMYERLVSQWHGPSVVRTEGESTSSSRLALDARLDDHTARMMLADTQSYRPDDILVKIDRAAMAVSLESRVPFLDHRVFELAWRVPMELKIRSGKGKWILRKVLYRHVPKALIERPKMGFGIPLDRWLRGALRTWAHDLLDRDALTRQGFFDANAVERRWREHLSGARNWQYALWNVLMFQAWVSRHHPELCH